MWLLAMIPSSIPDSGWLYVSFFFVGRDDFVRVIVHVLGWPIGMYGKDVV